MSLDSDGDSLPARSASPVEALSAHPSIEHVAAVAPNDPAALIEREHLIELLREATDRFEQATIVNAQLQRRLVDHFKQRKQGDEAPDQDKVGSMTDRESRYNALKEELREKQEELKKKRAAFDQEAMSRQAQLKEREAKAAEIRESSIQFKRDLAFLVAENSRTGKRISPEEIDAFETLDLKKDQEVERVRLKHISLRNHLKKLESQLQEKEKLKDGLHLIDFEQLKMENQTFNEKIEERNEDLLKLKKKIHKTVLVLTHVKEKLQFVQEDNQGLKNQLADLEVRVVTQRDTLTRTKQERDQLRDTLQKVKQQSALIGADDLLRDFDERQTQIEDTEQRLQAAITKHQSLTAQIQMYQAQQQQQPQALATNPQRGKPAMSIQHM